MPDGSRPPIQPEPPLGPGGVPPIQPLGPGGIQRRVPPLGPGGIQPRRPFYPGGQTPCATVRLKMFNVLKYH